MSKKSLRAVSGATLAVALVQTVQPVLADEVTNANTVAVKSEKLDAVVKEAAELGFTTTTSKEKRVAKTQEEFEKLQSEAKAELDELAAKIQKNVDADKQHKAKVKEAVDKVKNEEEEIKAKYPLISEKDGVRVYGKFNEEKKGSQAYYENIHAFTDREDITPIKDGIYVRQDSELTAEDGTAIHTPGDYLGRTFLGEEGKSPVGSKIKVSHVADTLDGKRVDAHIELVAFGNDFTSEDGFKNFLDSKGDVGVTLDDNKGIKSGQGYTQAGVNLDKESGILYFHAFDSGGYTYKITYKTEDGNIINPMSALVNIDIDYNQGIAISENNLITGILSPESKLTSGNIYDILGTSYKNAQYDTNRLVADYDKSIPEGSGIFIAKGGEFEYSHFFASDTGTGFSKEDYTNKRMTDGESISMTAGLFSKDVKVNLHTPEIPTAPAIEKEFELKEIEVSLEQQPTTTYVDENGKQLLPPEKGEKDKKDIPGYKFVETKKKENGDIEHVYKKISNITTYVDENGKELLPKEDGIIEKKEIPAYEYVRTNKKENGDVEHVYRQVKNATTYVDVNGKVLLPPKEGIHEKETITGYEFVRTDKKPNGDVEHVYKQVATITTYVDESGNELLPKKEGAHDKEVIDGYEFVRTVNKPNGDIEHVYKKKVVEKKLPATSVGIAGAVAALAGLTGVGAYFSKKKKR
jgi:surface repeat SSSPR-51 protein